MDFKDKIFIIDFVKVKGELEYHSNESLTFTLTEQNGEKLIFLKKLILI